MPPQKLANPFPEDISSRGANSYTRSRSTMQFAVLSFITLTAFLVLGPWVSEQTPLSLFNSESSPCGSALERIGDTEYDFIVVGGGPAGIVVADRLSESSPNVKVLLIERGNASTWTSGGRDQTWWMKGHDITRFDVPGLFQTDRRANYFCDDTEPLAGCVLGGGTAINSGLYFYPSEQDWDMNFPKDSGWTSKHMSGATRKAKNRLPSTDTPSADGKQYLTESYDIFGDYLTRKGWSRVSPNREVNSKNKHYGRSAYMTIAGERAGPLGTYLLSAMKRKNIDILLNTKVSRVLRNGPAVYGVEIETSASLPTSEGMVTIHVRNGLKAAAQRGEAHRQKLGKVILSAGALESPKILFRSGIGPRDVLETVQNNTAVGQLIEEKQWVDLPVGLNLVDHAATHLIFRHPDIVAYNHSGAWDNPNRHDMNLYLDKRSGPLAATNARLSLWIEVKGEDGIPRIFQGNARAGNALGNSHPNNILVTLYLGRGMTSRGRVSLRDNSNLTVTIPQTPYFTTKEDLNALIEAAQTILSDFPRYATSVEGLELILPTSSKPEVVEEYIRNYPLGAQLSRGGNHWMGSCMMGPGGVVGWDGKVKGMDNLFVMDASVFRGMVSSNPVGTIVVMAERGAERILGGK